MDARKLLQFLAVCEAGSITAAARRLNIAQPALSHAIQQLEEDLGVPLLVRHARGIALTEFGEIVAEQAHIVRRELGRTRTLVVERISSPAGKIRIGQPAMLAGGLAAPLLEAMKQHLGSVDIEFSLGDSKMLRDAVVAGQWDFALTYRADGDAEVNLHPLVVEDLAVLTRAPRDGGEKLTLIDLEAMSLVAPPRGDPVRTALDAAAHRAGVALTVAAEVAAVDDLAAMVDRCRCAAVMPRYAAERAARAGALSWATLSEPRAPLCLFLLTARNRPVQRGVATARDLLLETVENLVRGGLWPGRYVGHVDSAASLVTVFTNVG